MLDEEEPLQVSGFQVSYDRSIITQFSLVLHYDERTDKFEVQILA